ncbi:MAG: hypothetical protein FWD27_08865 [Coriobacteriia bacterium]|nr:hypothetical protein [Coriobacteriia bacterium]
MPQFVFQNQAEFIECLQTSDLASAEREIRAIWKYSTEEFFITMFTQEEREHAAQGNEQLYELLDPMTLEFGLGAEHIAEITFEEIDRNSSCILIEMLELDELLLCTFIAIVDKGEDGLAYYTVERTYGSEEDERAYMFCFVEQQGRGSIGTIESTKESVLEAIRQTSV